MIDDPFGLAEFPPPPGARERIAAAVLEGTRARDPDDPAPALDLRPRHRRRGRRAPWLVAVVAAALALVVGVVVARPGDDGTGDGTETFASGRSSTLADLAELARRGVDRPLRPGEYQHTLVEEASPYVGTDGAEGRAVSTVERWIDLADRGRELGSDPLLVAAGTPSTCVALARSGYDRRDDAPGSLPMAGLGYQAIRSLPTDAAGVRAELERVLDTDDVGAVGMLAADLLALDVTPPAVRGALFGALGDLGFEPLGQVADRAGRPGVGFARRSAGGVQVVVVDAGTGRTLEEYEGPSVDPALAERWRTVLRVSIEPDTGG